jgi:hypothetical protein
MPKEKAPVLKWTESIVGLAALILQQGFAVLSVDEDTTKGFQRAAQSARAFFCDSLTYGNKYAYQRFSTSGHLLGYNEPSPI